MLNGFRRHIPTYADDLCARYVDHRPVAAPYTQLDYYLANSIPEDTAHPYTCNLNNAVLRSSDQPEPRPAFRYHDGKRYWIPDGWTFDYYITYGWLVDGPTLAEIQGLPDGGTEPARLRPEVIAPNSIIRRNDGVSWVVDGNKVRHHIPYAQDDVCWRDLHRLPVWATGLTYDQANALGEADPWPCIIGPAIVHSSNGAIYFVDGTNTKRWIQDMETVNTLQRSYPDYGTWPAGDVNQIPEGAWMPKMINPGAVATTLICAANGNCYAVDGAGVRHWIPSYPDFVCWKYVNRWGVSRTGLSNEQMSSLQETNAWGCGLAGRILSTDTGASYYMSSQGTRNWIQDPESYWCYVGRGAPAFGPVPQGEANGIAEGGWMPRCLDPNRVKNHVVRVSDGTAYFIDAAGWWYWIPDGGVWNCLAPKYGVLIQNATWEQVNSIRRERGVRAYCGQ